MLLLDTLLNCLPQRSPLPTSCEQHSVHSIRIVLAPWLSRTHCPNIWYSRKKFGIKKESGGTKRIFVIRGVNTRCLPNIVSPRSSLSFDCKICRLWRNVPLLSRGEIWGRICPYILITHEIWKRIWWLGVNSLKSTPKTESCPEGKCPSPYQYGGVSRGWGWGNFHIAISAC